MSAKKSHKNGQAAKSNGSHPKSELYHMISAVYGKSEQDENEGLNRFDHFLKTVYDIDAKDEADYIYQVAKNAVHSHRMKNPKLLKKERVDEVVNDVFQRICKWDRYDLTSPRTKKLGLIKQTVQHTINHMQKEEKQKKRSSKKAA